MATPGTEPGKPKRLAEAMLTRSDIGQTELREMLQQADALVQQGQMAEAVQKFLSVGQFYSLRAQPMKAVQVLRQAARLQPDSSEVHLALGEALGQLKMSEDAVHAYTKAAALLEAQQRMGEWLDVVQKLLALDPGDLHGRLRLAEALSRAGKASEAALVLRGLAEVLLERGETEDWEKVAERLLHHDPQDTTTAHDLALHYVRSGRHARALPKLVLCFEVEPNDAELLELIIDTLESLGQREKAAAICRKLLQGYKSTGLRAEVERTLERLYHLDPEDPEARTYMGVLQPAVEGGTLLDFDSGVVPAHRSDSGSHTSRRAHSGAHGHHPVETSRPTQPAPPPSMEDDDLDGATAMLAAPAKLQRAISPPVPLSASSGRHAAVAALQALAEAEPPSQTAEVEEEADFDFEDRTVFEASPGLIYTELNKAAAASAAAAAPQAQPAQPGLAQSAASAAQPVVAARQRSNSLPRPRLARRPDTVTELPSSVRDMSKDLSTLDFFIERGFYDSAVALLDELQRRHPTSARLLTYRQRIERMHQG